jgi:hypothetical protein
MKRALLVGSSFSAVPVFSEMKRRGLHVSVCGNLESDPCHDYADVSHYIDYSQREDLLRLVETGGFDYLVPTCNDYSYLSSAWVAARLGYPGFDDQEVVKILHTKNAFRGWMMRHQLPGPHARRYRIGDPVDVGELRSPFLVKPDDAFSGRGVTKVMRQGDLPAAIDAALAASRCGEVVIEEFVDGRLYSHSAFVRQGRIAVDFFVDEYCTVYPYQVNCSNHPSSLPAEIRAGVRAAITRLAELLGLHDGLLHTQFIADDERFWIIECMRRCPGDLYGSLVELSTGVRYTDLFVRPFLGEDLPEGLPPGQVRPWGRHTISSRQPLATFSFSCDIPGAGVRVVPLKDSGEKLAVAPFDKLAILFAEYTDEAVMLELTPRLDELVTIHSHDGVMAGAISDLPSKGSKT